MKIITSGKRKSAVARVVLTEGNGQITLNKRAYQNLQFFDRLRIEEPIKITEKIIGNLNVNAAINTRGGGEKSQIEAARLALGRALSTFYNSKELTETFLNYDRGLFVADVRRKETYKPGDSKARRKRQKSYR